MLRLVKGGKTTERDPVAAFWATDVWHPEPPLALTPEILRRAYFRELYGSYVVDSASLIEFP